MSLNQRILPFRKTFKKIETVISHIGTLQNTTLFGLGCELSKDIGKTPDDRTLTGQHKDMQALIQKEIDTAERRYIEDEQRIRNFTAEQHNMVKVINEFKLFMDSWERLASENSDMQQKIYMLEGKIYSKEKENQSLLNINKQTHAKYVGIAKQYNELAHKYNEQISLKKNFQEDWERGDEEEETLEI